jgi:hypothetical protein
MRVFFAIGSACDSTDASGFGARKKPGVLPGVVALWRMKIDRD